MQSWAPLKAGSAFSGAHTPGAGGNQNQRDPGKMERGGGGGRDNGLGSLLPTVLISPLLAA